MTAGASARRTRSAIGAVLVVIAAVNVSRSLWVPGGWHLWWNLGFAAAVVGVGAWAGMRAGELGLARSTWGSGARWGGAAFVAVAAVIVAAGLLPSAGDLMADDRTAVSVGTMLVRTLVLIPLGTVVVEELVFRGVLLGLARRLADAVPAALGVSLVFGLWHLLPVWRAGGDGRLGAMTGTFAATFAAGLAFAWLRERSGSLLAPAAAHLATNSVAFAVAWAVAR